MNSTSRSSVTSKFALFQSLPKSKLILFGVIAFFVLSGVGGGVYFLGLRQQASVAPQTKLFFNAQTTLTPTTNPTVTPLAGSDTSSSPPNAQVTVIPGLLLYRTGLYTMNYPFGWHFDYYSIKNGVQIFDPSSMIKDASTSSGKLIPSTFLTIVTLVSSESAATFADKYQVACCIGPSISASMAATFKKQSVSINGVTAAAFTPIGAVPQRAWDIVFGTGKHQLLIYSSITDPQGTRLENQLINSIKLLE